jgi:hypothetical protein
MPVPLDYKLSLQEERDLPKKITKCTKTMGIISNALNPLLIQKHAPIRLYKTLARSVLCNGSEA